MTERKIILIVSEKESEFKQLENQLNDDGFELVFFQTAQPFLEAIKNYQPKLIVLDIILADMDGVELLIKLKEDYSLAKSWIVFFSDRNEDYSKVAGLEAGADDYIVKPIHPRLLLAKIKSILRRRKVLLETKNSTLNKNGFILNPSKRMVKVNNREIQLLIKEFDLLRMFLEFPGKVFSRNEIKTAVWKGDQDLGDRNVDVHISNLRKKLGKSSIQTIKGVGYKFIA
jgi:two-component system alkaline phosphatase synthesis response regulator PhoP